MARTKLQEVPRPPQPEKPISDIAPEEAEMQAPRQPQRPNEEEIRARAYHRYEARGRSDGQADEDWYQAEKDLQSDD